MTATTAPKATKSTKTTKSTVSLSSVYAKRAAKLSIDTTRAAKLVRSQLRSNFSKVVELDPSIVKVKKSANDGNRWPQEISKDLAEFLNSK